MRGDEHQRMRASRSAGNRQRPRRLVSELACCSLRFLWRRRGRACPPVRPSALQPMRPGSAGQQRPAAPGSRASWTPPESRPTPRPGWAAGRRPDLRTPHSVRGISTAAGGLGHRRRRLGGHGRTADPGHPGWRHLPTGHAGLPGSDPAAVPVIQRGVGYRGPLPPTATAGRGTSCKLPPSNASSFTTSSPRLSACEPLLARIPRSGRGWPRPSCTSTAGVRRAEHDPPAPRQGIEPSWESPAARDRWQSETTITIHIVLRLDLSSRRKAAGRLLPQLS